MAALSRRWGQTPFADGYEKVWAEVAVGAGSGAGASGSTITTLTLEG